RTLQDNAVLLNAVAKLDREDFEMSARREEDFTRNIGKKVSGLTMGIPNQHYFDDLDKEIGKIMDRTISVFKHLGVEFISVDIPNIENMLDAQRVIQRNEALAVH